MSVPLLMFAAITQVDMSDGTLAWIVAGCLITFLLSRKKGRTLTVSLAWALLSGGAGFFLGSVGTGLIEKAVGAKIPGGAGEFFISSTGIAWIPAAFKKLTKKAEGFGE